MTEQRFVFGEVAALYDRHRPGYPDALIEQVLAFAELPTHAQLLEIGCGTGQATRSFAERGYAVTCLEPSPQMAAVALGNLEAYTRVEIVVETFEAWPPPERPFHLVYSAQAFHWLDPDVRFEKSARSLRPGGVLALFGHRPLRGESAVRDELDRDYAACAPSLAAREPGSWPKGPPIAEGFAACAAFGAVSEHTFRWSREWSASDYVEMLQTQSDHALLPEAVQRTLFERIEATVNRHGGSITVDYATHLQMAKRRG